MKRVLFILVLTLTMSSEIEASEYRGFKFNQQGSGCLLTQQMAFDNLSIPQAKEVLSKCQSGQPLMVKSDLKGPAINNFIEMVPFLFCDYKRQIFSSQITRGHAVSCIKR